MRVPENITLLPRPPYPPERNPMESIRGYLRGNRLGRRVRDSDQAILVACKDAWLFLVGDSDGID